MKIEKLNRGAICVGAMRLLPIDFGFDPKLHGAIDMSAFDESLLVKESASRDSSGVGYESSDGTPCLAHGTRDEIAMLLASEGFTVVAARTPNGREVRCEPKNPNVFVCQPATDNYWKKFPTVEAAIAQFS
jgi:hypothetical protein